MKWLMTLVTMVACGALIGCDYTVPLVETPPVDLDPGIVGLWQTPREGGQMENLLVLPLGKREYLVSYPAGSPEAMFARACLCRHAGKTLVQLEWFGTAQAKLPEDHRVFQFAAYSVSGDTLTVRLLNADLVKRDVKSRAELAKAILDNQDSPDVFRKPTVFKKVKD